MTKPILATLLLSLAAVCRAAEPDALFSTCYTVTDFEAGDVNAFERGRFVCQPAESLDHGLLRADFSTTDRISVSHSLTLFGIPDEMRLTVEADAEAAGAELEIVIGSHFMRFFRTIGTLPPPQAPGSPIRHTFAVPAPPAEGWRWENGENDGIPKYPLRFSAITLRKGRAQAERFNIRLVSLDVQSRLPRSETLALRTRLLAPEDGAPATLTGELRNFDAAAHAGTLAVRLTGWDGDTLGSVTTNLAAPPSGGVGRFTLTLPPFPPGRLFVESSTVFTPSETDVPPATWTSTWAARPSDAGSPAPRPDLPWGVGVYLYRNARTADGYLNMDRAAAAAQAAGVKWTREEFQWDRIEPQRGTYDFSFYDRLADTAARHGISVYAIVAFWTPWTKPYETSGFDDYCAFLRVLVRRYKDRIKHWEIYNEPNIFFWSGPRERYPVLLKRAYETVKAEDPDAQVLGCSTSEIDTRFIQMCLDAGAPFDMLTIHPYRPALREQTFVDELSAVHKQVGNRPVWITEMGWPTISGRSSSGIAGKTERQQAALLARCYLTAIGSGASHNICWYNFRNDGWNPYYDEENFGICQKDLTPKPAYRALASVCRTFEKGGIPTLARLPLGDEKSAVYLFRMGTASALWSDTTAAVPVDVTLSGNPEARNLMGEPIVPEKKNGCWRVLTDAQHPLFFPHASISGVTAASAAPRD